MKLHNFPIVVVDVETSGLYPEIHEVLEIGAHCYPNRAALLEGGTFEAFNVFLVMERPEGASPEALAIGRYAETPEERRVPQAEGLKAFAYWLDEHAAGRSLVMGWNVAFDIAFLRMAARRAGVSLGFGHRSLDLVAVAYDRAGADLEGASLATVCEHLGISNEGAHGAVRDVERTAAVYRALQRA